MKHQTVAELISQNVLQSFKEAIEKGDEYPYTNNKEFIINRLIKLTNHENSDVRASAYCSLGRIYIYKASKTKDKGDLKGIFEKVDENFLKFYIEPKSINIERVNSPIENFLEIYLNYQKKIDAQFQKYIVKSKNVIKGVESQEKMILSIKKLEQSLTKEQDIRKFGLELWNCRDDTDLIKLYKNFYGSMVQEIPNNIEKESNKKTEPIHILHLSGLHINDPDQADIYCVDLKNDLLGRMKVKRLDYLVISGDVGNLSIETEYKAALEFVSKLSKCFKLESRNIIIVPGNHDVNYDISRKAYIYIKKEPVLLDGSYIILGDGSLRDEQVYKKRFANFNKYFYEPICKEEYSTEYSEQAKLYIFNDHKILFFALNSAWEIDHDNQKRAGINRKAFKKQLNKLICDDTYKSWLKIVVSHHPLNWSETINPESKDQIHRGDFNIIMHGHITEAFKDCPNDRIIRAGNFGEPVNQRESGILFKYNFLRINPNNQKITVNPRKKNNIDDQWVPQCCNNKNNKSKSYYEINLKDWAIENGAEDEEKEKGSKYTGINTSPNNIIKKDGVMSKSESSKSINEKIELKNESIEKILDKWCFRPGHGNREEKKADIEKWLHRFLLSEFDDAFLILEGIQYHDSHDVDGYIKGLSIELKNVFDDDLSKILFYPLGESPSSSGGNLLYSYRKDLGLSESSFPYVPLKDIDLSGKKAIVFFDDIIGSGNQAVRFAEKHLHEIKIDKYYVALMAFEKGLENVRNNDCFKKVIAHEIISEELRAFSPESQIFTDTDTRERIKRLCEKYGKELYPKHPLGYDDSQALIVFPHNTPNNSLPIIWASEKNEKEPGYIWCPVWERIKKVMKKSSEPSKKDYVNSQKRMPKESDASKLSNITEERRISIILQSLLDSYINDGELQIICHNIGVDYDNLGQGAKAVKIKELLLHLERRQQLELIINWLSDKRQDIWNRYNKQLEKGNST